MTGRDVFSPEISSETCMPVNDIGVFTDIALAEGLTITSNVLPPDGSLCYSLDYKGSSLVKESRLGLVSDEADFTHGFKIAGTDTLSVDRTDHKYSSVS